MKILEDLKVLYKGETYGVETINFKTDRVFLQNGPVADLREVEIVEGYLKRAEVEE